MEQPPGFSNPRTPNLVCNPHKALYGLKQAPRAWFDKLHRALISFDFVSAKSDLSLFVKITPQHNTYLLVYVNDILLTGSDQQVINTLI